jgi:hypothetical protein
MAESRQTRSKPAADADAQAIATYVQEERLSVDDTVALAEGDVQRARVVLQAEQSGGDARKGVEEALNKLIAEGSGRPEAPPPEPRFTVDQLVEGAREKFDVSPHIVAGALWPRAAQSYTQDEAAALVKQFADREHGEETA